MRCPECSSTFITQPDDEGLIDCCEGECGIRFDPHARCFENEEQDAPGPNGEFFVGVISGIFLSLPLWWLILWVVDLIGRYVR